jgi:hypothetical protein
VRTACLCPMYVCTARSILTLAVRRGFWDLLFASLAVDFLSHSNQVAVHPPCCFHALYVTFLFHFFPPCPFFQQPLRITGAHGHARRHLKKNIVQICQRRTCISGLVIPLMLLSDFTRCPRHCMLCSLSTVQTSITIQQASINNATGANSATSCY